MKALAPRPSRKKTLRMSEMKEIKAGRERWPKGIGVEATSKEIDDYITFKITEYIHYNFQDDEL